MRVIKENKTERKHKCEHCDSIFAYLPSEVSHFIYSTIRCPVCENMCYTSIFDKKVKTNE